MFLHCDAFPSHLVIARFLLKCSLAECVFLLYAHFVTVSIEPPPPRSWIALQEPDRTRPAGKKLLKDSSLGCVVQIIQIFSL